MSTASDLAATLRPDYVVDTTDRTLDEVRRACEDALP